MFAADMGNAMAEGMLSACARMTVNYGSSDLDVGSAWCSITGPAAIDRARYIGRSARRRPFCRFTFGLTAAPALELGVGDSMRPIRKMRWRFTFFNADNAFSVAVFALVKPMPKNHAEHRQCHEQSKNHHDGVGLQTE